MSGEKISIPTAVLGTFREVDRPMLLGQYIDSLFLSESINIYDEEFASYVDEVLLWASTMPYDSLIVLKQDEDGSVRPCRLKPRCSRVS